MNTDDIWRFRSEVAVKLGLDIELFDLTIRRRGSNRTALRMAIAAELLRRHGLSRAQIADVLGYSKPGIDNLLTFINRLMSENSAMKAHIGRLER